MQPHTFIHELSMAVSCYKAELSSWNGDCIALKA